MKFFVAFALIVAVASAGYIKPTVVSGEEAQIHEIIAAIQSPSTDPATAAALEAMLLDVLGLTPDPVIVVEEAAEPIAVGPAIIDQPQDVVVGPAIVDQPQDVIVGPVIVDLPTEVQPSPAPVAVAEPATSAPLVQIILNINQAESAAVNPAPAVIPETVSPVQIVDVMPVVAPESPIDVVDVMPGVETAPVTPVEVVDVAPVEVVDTAPVAVEPVVIGTPIIPSPVINLPEELN